MIAGQRVRMKYFGRWATGEITIIREKDCKVIFDGKYDLEYTYYPMGELEPVPKYEISEELQRQLDNSYTYHAPKGDQPERYVQIRDKAKELAEIICKCAPHSRERSIALTDLEKVVTMANKAIACNE